MPLARVAARRRSARMSRHCIAASASSCALGDSVLAIDGDQNDVAALALRLSGGKYRARRPRRHRHLGRRKRQAGKAPPQSDLPSDDGIVVDESGQQ